MSWDCYLERNGRTVELAERHHLKGGTYPLGGTTQACFNVTYNYGRIFRRVGIEDALNSFNGKTAQETIPIMEAAIAQLNDDPCDDYWQPTEGNARRALEGLLVLARAAPDAVWVIC